MLMLLLGVLLLLLFENVLLLSLSGALLMFLGIVQLLVLLFRPTGIFAGKSL